MTDLFVDAALSAVSAVTLPFFGRPESAREVTPRLALVTVVFGQAARAAHIWPFLFTARHSGADALLWVGDAPACGLPEWVRFKSLQWEGLKLLVQQHDVNASRWISPYKAADLKPLYGLLFMHELRHFSHWAALDNDVLLGDLRPVLPLLSLVDVAPPWGPCYRKLMTEDQQLGNTNSLYAQHFNQTKQHSAVLWICTWGPLTFYRNLPHITALWEHNRKASSREILSAPSCCGFDEWKREAPDDCPDGDRMSEIVHQAVRDGQIRPAPSFPLGDMYTDLLEMPGTSHSVCTWKLDQQDMPSLVRRQDNKTVVLCHFQYFKKAGAFTRLNEVLWSDSNCSQLRMRNPRRIQLTQQGIFRGPVHTL